MQRKISCLFFISIAFLIVMIQGCAQSARMPKENIPPKIRALKDLGHYASINNVSVAKVKSDNPMYPGEWLSISGQDLMSRIAKIPK